MRFGYTIVYVPDVEAALTFYERAFGIERAFVSDEGLYGALATGETTLAFVGHEQAHTLGTGYRPIIPGEAPPGFEIALSTDDVDAAFERAVGVGAASVTPPADKPWGERIAYVRDLNGLLVELTQPLH
jgi:uncharacterized glyoxalase superfamily protein PhnB